MFLSYCNWQVHSRQWLDRKNEGSAITLESVGYSIDETTKAAWAEREKEENKLRKEEALEFIRNAAASSNPVKAVGGQWKVLPQWRELMAKEMLDDPNSEIGLRVTPPTKFPKDKPGRTYYSNDL